MISRANIQGSQYELTAKTHSTENFWYKDRLQSLLTKLMLGKTAIVDPNSQVNSSARRSCELMKISSSVLTSLGVWQSTVFLWFLRSILRASITACCVFTLILILSKLLKSNQSSHKDRGTCWDTGITSTCLQNQKPTSQRQNPNRNPLRRGVNSS